MTTYFRQYLDTKKSVFQKYILGLKEKPADFANAHIWRNHLCKNVGTVIKSYYLTPPLHLPMYLTLNTYLLETF